MDPGKAGSPQEEGNLTEIRSLGGGQSIQPRKVKKNARRPCENSSLTLRKKTGKRRCKLLAGNEKETPRRRINAKGARLYSPLGATVERQGALNKRGRTLFQTDENYRNPTTPLMSR